MRGRRLEREIQIFRDGELPPARREKLQRLLGDSPEAARALRRSEALGGAVRATWSEGPPAPEVADLMRAIRPELARIDRECQRPRVPAPSLDLGSWLRPLRLPALATATAAVALWLFATSPSIDEPIRPQTAVPVPTPAFSTARPPGLRVAPANFSEATVYELAEGDSPVMVLEGGEGATIIWVLDQPEDLSRREPHTAGWA